MYSKLSRLFPTVVIGLALTLHAPPVVGQSSLWLDGRTDKHLALEILKPNFEGDVNTTFATQALFLSLRYPLSPKVVLIADVPFAHYGMDGSPETESTIGNPYIGIEARGENSPVSGEFGIRLPLVSSDNPSAQFVGAFVDLDRWEAFWDDFVPISAMLNARWRSVQGVVTKLRVGPTLWASTGDDGDTELLLDYTAQIGYEGERGSVIGGFTGVMIVTEDDANFGERTYHQAGVAGSLRFNRVMPGMSVRLPLDEDMRDIHDVVVGIHVSIELN
jgi:hypothetical protein